MIDASNIYTPQRAQNIMSDTDVEEIFNLYTDYQDVVEKSKVVTLEEIRNKEYSLAINNYVEKKKQEVTPPEEVRKQYFEALQATREAEVYMKELLIEGGYVNE